MLTRALLLAVSFTLLATLWVYADEGMWLFNRPPRKLLKERYGFDPTDKWLEHVQKSSVRFNSGGSGAIFLPGCLVLANHPPGPHNFEQINRKKEDYDKGGLHTQKRPQEDQ